MRPLPKALVTLRDLPEVHAVSQLLLGVLSLRFEKLTFLCDSIGFPRTSLSSLHRSRTGMISPWIQLVISDLRMLFDFVPETCSLGLHRPSELNLGEWRASVLSRIAFYGIPLRCWKRTCL